ncbi:MAG: hypothetical protein DMD61_09980 [Gemmatimonadetes bacterium]|nr:MAG: hypothetical protein DMD61_09980 [Gemmatimonadota bacterium]
MSKFYLTTAIDYSNGEPHLGHALEKIGADCIARYHRFKGDDVHFVMGMDEHGQKVAQAAEKQDLPPQAWVDRIAASFEATWHRLDCSNDDWIRTTEPRHTASVTAFIGRIRERHPDDIFIGEYEGLYCVGCEEFKQPSQIVDGHCVEHPTLTLQRLKETNYFFRLSRYAQRLHGLITSGEFRVEPEIRRNEILRLLEDGLARGPARDRQGHHPAALRALAGHAALGQPRAAAARVGPRVRPVGRCQGVEVHGWRLERRRSDRPSRCGRPALLSAA